jgi:RecA/RadA recombinase
MERKRSIKEQVKRKVASGKTAPKKPEYTGNDKVMISTGSTLLDLAISGGRKRGGGIPGGIMVEFFGPSGSGKTVLLCEIAGDVKRNGGQVMFKDPEARLDKQFASIFDLDIDEIDYDTPNTVPETFKPIRDWEPDDLNKINGIFADSLAALSTDLEMDNDDGDKMGMRRAKEFSEQLRKTARVLAKNNYLLVCSNQVRQNANAGSFVPKYKSPGGEAIGFYSSLRLRAYNPSKIKKKVKVAGKEVSRVVGIETMIEVFKSTVWKPYITAPIIIYFDYGIDDIRANLQYIKDFTKNTTYTCDGENLDRSLDASIQMVEEQGLEADLKNEVIELWEAIQSKFDSNRIKKKRV